MEMHWRLMAALARQTSGEGYISTVAPAEDLVGRYLTHPIGIYNNTPDSK
jgi:hypothetical protein